ncbi:MAG: PQQ-binding-like beta-propeller repeat protein [Pirellulaceae bacterium]|nr:PQQ-binding-like beta-propeller repeat protein [Pirellulaceae bacterium]
MNARFIALCCVTAVLLITLSERTGAADWPEFRGPDGQGHASTDNLPLKWSGTENVTWKTPVPGSGWSSPILYRGRLYLTTAVPDSDQEDSGYSLRVLALEADSGQVAWDVEMFRQPGEQAPKIHRKNSHASPTPLARGDQLFIHFGHQGTACLDLTGKILWRQTSLGYQPVHGNGGSPILVDNKLIFSTDGAERTKVIALETETGNVVWEFDRQSTAVKKFSFSTPLAIEVDGAKQIVSPGSDVVSGLDAETGRELWRVRYDGYSVIPRPVYGQGLVFVCTGYNRPSLLAIDPTGQGDVTDTHVRWQTDKSVPHTPSLLLVDELLYMVSDRGVVSCLVAKTGEVQWQERADGNYSASPLFAAGRIYLQSEEGVTTVLAAGPRFQQLARNELNEPTLASHAVDRSTLFLRTASQLYRIDER